MNIRLITAFATLSCLNMAALAQVTVADPWVRATVPAQKATGAFMQLTAKQDSRLIAVKSPVAGMVEVHEMAMDKDVMTMRAVTGGLPLPAGKTVELKPGGYHVMLMDLKQPVKEGETVALKLTVEDKTGKRSELDVAAVARPLGASAAPAADSHAHHGSP
jgi:copper(I)-binding protein